MQDDGLMRSMVDSLRHCNFLGRTGIRYTSMWEQGVVPRQGHMLRNTSISFKGKELRKLNRSFFFFLEKTQ